MAAVTEMTSREILDSRGNLTAEVDMRCEDGAFSAAVRSRRAFLLRKLPSQKPKSPPETARTGYLRKQPSREDATSQPNRSPRNGLIAAARDKKKLLSNLPTSSSYDRKQDPQA